MLSRFILCTQTHRKQGKTVDYENKPKQRQRQRHEIRHTEKETKMNYEKRHIDKRQTNILEKGRQRGRKEDKEEKNLYCKKMHGNGFRQ